MRSAFCHVGIRFPSFPDPPCTEVAVPNSAAHFAITSRGNLAKVGKHAARLDATSAGPFSVFYIKAPSQ